MNAIAVIDTTTTLNDLFGSHNCPIMFRAEVYPGDDLLADGKVKEIVMVPDEDVLGNGIAVHGMSRKSIMGGVYGKPTSLELGLETVRDILTKFSQNGIPVAGYGLNNILKNLDENCQRVLKKPLELNDGLLLDIEKLAKLCVDVHKCGNYSLYSVASAVLDGDFHEDWHRCDRSLSHRMHTAKIVLHAIMLSAGLNGGIDKVLDFISAPHNVQTFSTGKYKGALIDVIAKTDKQYLSWILKNKQFYENDQNMLRKVSEILNSEET